MQPYEDVLPYEDFSLRLDNRDVPSLREILRNVSEHQYRQLLAGVLRHAPAFSWDQPTGGRAFHYTLLSLRRKYMNLKVHSGCCELLGGHWEASGRPPVALPMFQRVALFTGARRPGITAQL